MRGLCARATFGVAMHLIVQSGRFFLSGMAVTHTRPDFLQVQMMFLAMRRAWLSLSKQATSRGRSLVWIRGCF